MVAATILASALEALVMLLRFVLAFFAFWLVLRALEGWLPEHVLGVQELDPLACAFTDPIVDPVSRWTRLSVPSTCWRWLGVLATVQVRLEWATPGVRRFPGVWGGPDRGGREVPGG